MYCDNCKEQIYDRDGYINRSVRPVAWYFELSHDRKKDMVKITSLYPSYNGGYMVTRDFPSYAVFNEKIYQNTSTLKKLIDKNCETICKLCYHKTMIKYDNQTNTHREVTNH